MKLTVCEAMVYDAMKKERRKMTALEVTELTNRTCGKNWPLRAVKAFLKRLVDKGYVEKTRTVLKTYYALKDSPIPTENNSAMTEKRDS